MVYLLLEETTAVRLRDPHVANFTTIDILIAITGFQVSAQATRSSSRRLLSFRLAHRRDEQLSLQSHYIQPAEPGWLRRS